MSRPDPQQARQKMRDFLDSKLVDNNIPVAYIKQLLERVIDAGPTVAELRRWNPEMHEISDLGMVEDAQLQHDFTPETLTFRQYLGVLSRLELKDLLLRNTDRCNVFGDETAYAHYVAYIAGMDEMLQEGMGINSPLTTHLAFILEIENYAVAVNGKKPSADILRDEIILLQAIAQREKASSADHADAMRSAKALEDKSHSMEAGRIFGPLIFSGTIPEYINLEDRAELLRLRNDYNAAAAGDDRQKRRDIRSEIEQILIPYVAAQSLVDYQDEANSQAQKSHEDATQADIIMHIIQEIRDIAALVNISLKSARRK